MGVHLAPVHCFAVQGPFVFFSRNSSEIAANTQPTLWGVLLEFECVQMNGACLSPPNFTARARIFSTWRMQESAVHANDHIAR